MLKTLATLPKLVALNMSEIPEDSMSVFLENFDQPWFPGLRYLYIGAAAKTLELVRQIVPDIEAIGVFNEDLGQTDNDIYALSRFHRLTRVLIRPSDRSTIRGTKLL
jgi:hypothetical protein